MQNLKNIISNLLNNKPLLKKIGLGIVVFAITWSLSFKFVLPIINRILGCPDLSILENYQPIGSIEIYDYRDNFIGVLQGKEDRQVVKLSQISDFAKQAVLAAEDSEFFHHHGLSLTAMLRATFTNLKAGKILQGGSTISQQMVKNLFIKEEERYQRTFTRKISELLIAFEVESKYPKEKILEIYLNQVYFGNLAYGIERAAQRYFSKPASRLTIDESAYLAGLLTAPSYLSKNLEAAMQRQRYVLLKMYENGYISKADYDKASKTKVQFRESKGNFSLFPYYFSYIEEQLSKRFNRSDLKSMGLKVYTGMDQEAQRLAEYAAETGISNAAEGINQAAVVTIDVETAEVRALVGGVGNYWQHQYNSATNVHTIGSAFKPFVYLTAFMEGIIDPGTIIDDSPLEIPDVSLPSKVWKPQNFDEEFHGPITAKAALVFSRNIPAIKVAMKTGIKNIIQTAKAAGIKTDMEPVLSLALGSRAFTPLEIANAYSTLARGGTQIEPIIIRKITDSKGRVLELNEAVPRSGLPEQQVSQLVTILEDVVEYGTGSMAKIPGQTIAGKTGTADGSRDIWFIGFTPYHVTAVWCGNEKNKEVFSRYATGGSTPAWIWREYMSKYYEVKPRPVKGFSFHGDHNVVAIDPLTGLKANEYTPNPVYKRFAPGTEPTEEAPIPEADAIKPRGGSDGFKDHQKNLSQEDKQMKTARHLEHETPNDTKAKPEKYIPKPKYFELKTHPTEAAETSKATTEKPSNENNP